MQLETNLQRGHCELFKLFMSTQRDMLQSTLEIVECFEVGQMSFWVYELGIKVFGGLVFFGVYLYLGLCI